MKTPVYKNDENDSKELLTLILKFQIALKRYVDDGNSYDQEFNSEVKDLKTSLDQISERVMSA